MSLLSYTEICELIKEGVVKGAEFSNVNAASLDLTLGSALLVEKEVLSSHDRTVDLRYPHTNPMTRVADISNNPYYMAPGEFVLGHTREMFYLPRTISAMFMLKSTMARNGLNHHNAGWCDAGWSNSSLTLEFKNDLRNHSVILETGMKCGQVIFFRHEEVPLDKSYGTRGSYNGDQSVQASKGLK